MLSGRAPLAATVTKVSGTGPLVDEPSPQGRIGRVAVSGPPAPPTISGAVVAVMLATPAASGSPRLGPRKNTVPPSDPPAPPAKVSRTDWPAPGLSSTVDWPARAVRA